MSISTPDISRGTVPDKLLVVMRKTETFSQTIDGIEHRVRATPTFFTDADGKTETATEWGTVSEKTGKMIEVSHPKYGGGVHTYVAAETVDTPPEDKVVVNKPFTNIRLWTIDTRMEGGRAYKFIDENGCMFDMREDTFLEAVYNNEVHTVDNKVLLTGQYIWVRAHSQMRVARVGSLIHKGLLEAKRRKNLPKITGKQQKIGGVYETKSGERYVYIGRDRDGTGKLCWSYVQLREPYTGFNEAQIAIYEKWAALNLQEKFDHERTTRIPSGCAELRCTAITVVIHLGDVDLGDDDVDTLRWGATKLENGLLVKF